jgi:subtilisin family serine protease
MKRICIVLIVLAAMCSVTSANAQTQRLIVRDKLGLSALHANCLVLGCTVVTGLGDPLGQVFLVTVNSVNLTRVLSLLPLQLGVLSVEVDQLLSLTSPILGPIPQELDDTYPVKYYSGVVWHGYLTQKGNQIIRTSQTQSAFHVSGAGTVAVIDTGIDPTHPAFFGVLLPGYDFTRNTASGSEMGDLDHSTAAVLDGGQETPMYVNPTLAAVLSKPAASALSNPNYAAFGHGTMTAGLVHLVAPTAKILPLKAFSANGSGYLSNVVRAIYYASSNHANVISMSFSFSSSSSALINAISTANTAGVICVAAAGNDGKDISVYPASLAHVMGVASTSNTDVQSSFTNYGPQVVWVAAPGEDVMSTYPGSTYASSSGTSFSTPLVAGTAALLVNVSPKVNENTAASAIAHAKWLSPNLNNGRLDTYQAVNAWTFASKTSH